MDEKFAEGAVVGLGHAVGKAAGEAIIEKSKALARDFINKKNGFLGPDATQGIRDTRSAPELDTYARFFSDPSHKPCFLAGLYLRKIAADQPRVKAYRSKLRDLYGANGLHIAEAVQAEVLEYVRAALEKRCRTTTEYHNRMVELFRNISFYVLFVEADDSEEYETETLRKHLKRHGPPCFIVAGSGGAILAAKNIAHTARQRLGDEYALQTIDDEANRTNFVLCQR